MSCSAEITQKLIKILPITPFLSEARNKRQATL